MTGETPEQYLARIAAALKQAGLRAEHEQGKVVVRANTRTERVMQCIPFDHPDFDVSVMQVRQGNSRTGVSHHHITLVPRRQSPLPKKRR